MRTARAWRARRVSPAARSNSSTGCTRVTSSSSQQAGGAVPRGIDIGLRAGGTVAAAEDRLVQEEPGGPELGLCGHRGRPEKHRLTVPVQQFDGLPDQSAAAHALESEVHTRRRDRSESCCQPMPIQPPSPNSLSQNRRRSSGSEARAVLRRSAKAATGRGTPRCRRLPGPLDLVEVGVGVMQGQNWNLAALAEDGRYVFLLSAPPETFTGNEVAAVTQPSRSSRREAAVGQNGWRDAAQLTRSGCPESRHPVSTLGSPLGPCPDPCRSDPPSPRTRPLRPPAVPRPQRPLTTSLSPSVISRTRHVNGQSGIRIGCVRFRSTPRSGPDQNSTLRTNYLAPG